MFIRGENMKKKPTFKKIVVLGIIALLLTLSSQSVLGRNQREDSETEYYAIIVACSKYKDWKNNIPKFPFPPFPEKKLKIFYEALLDTQNWKEENIILLLNDDATRQNIVDAFDVMATQVGPEDIFLFTWNGHGSIVDDDDGDEQLSDASDMYDEIICPYDCERDEDDELINFIRDDELDAYLLNISCKGICCIFESCHSGGLVDTESFSLQSADFRDVDGPNRVIITSTLPSTLGRASYLTASPILYAFSKAAGNPANDYDGDGNISIEEAFKAARPLIFLQNGLFWLGNWIYMYIYNLLDLYEVIPFKKPSTVERLFNKPALSATCSLINSYVVTQLYAKLLSGAFMLNYPHMVDHYSGELPLFITA